MSNTKTLFTTLSILFAIFIVIFAFSYAKRKSNSKTETFGISENVVMEGGIQKIKVISKMGGYSPKIIYAKSNTPSVLEIESINSYGCERAFQIPSLNIYEELPNNGKTLFELGSPNKDMLGTCSMGMYTFIIKFI
jgi:plastocyanin domain-containing protein